MSSENDFSSRKRHGSASEEAWSRPHERMDRRSSGAAVLLEGQRRRHADAHVPKSALEQSSRNLSRVSGLCRIYDTDGAVWPWRRGATTELRWNESGDARNSSHAARAVDTACWNDGGVQRGPAVKRGRAGRISYPNTVVSDSRTVLYEQGQARADSRVQSSWRGPGIQESADATGSRAGSRCAVSLSNVSAFSMDQLLDYR